MCVILMIIRESFINEQRMLIKLRDLELISKLVISISVQISKKFLQTKRSDNQLIYRSFPNNQMKGQLSVDPIYTSLGIIRPTILLKNPVVAFDNHRLHFRGKSILWDTSRTIINCTYSHEYQALLLLCDDWKLSVYNDNLDQIARLLNWQSKYTVGFEFIEKLGAMLLIGVSSVEVLRINVVTNIKKTKFLSSVKFAIQKREFIRQNKDTRLKWNKGYGYDLNNRLLFVWSLQDINFYSLQKIDSKVETKSENKLQLKSEIRNLVKKQEPITYVYFNSSYKYTVTGLFNGNVRVWRVPLFLATVSKATTPSDYIMIHNCNHHTKQVDNIVATHDDRVIISQSADLTVCMWSLETFQLLRVYDFEGEYQKVMLYGHQGALAIKDNMLGELKFGKTMEFIMELSNMIVTHDKSFHSLPKMHGNKQLNNQIESIQLTLSSNMAIQLRNESFKEKDLNKIDVDFFYPPLKSQQIKQVISCPFVKNRFYLLAETGKIYKVRMEGLSSIIEHYYSVNLTHDTENHPLSQLPTLIKFLNIVPAEFDSEIIEPAIFQKQNTSPKIQNIVIQTEQSIQQKFQQMKLLTVGCNKGSIVFLPIDNMDHIYTRITYHREEIVSIETVYQQSIKNSYLVSVCIQKHMRFVKFQQDKAICFRTIYLENSLNFIRGFEDRLAVVLFNGMFEVMYFDTQNNDQLCAVPNYQALNHQGDILSLDVDLQKEIILTAGKDNKIKIWTFYKIELYEIFLDEGLKYAVFSNEYQILVSHSQKLLYIREIPFSVSKEQIDRYNGEFLENNVKNLITIKQFLGQKPQIKQTHHLLKHKDNSLNLRKKQQQKNIDNQYERIRLKISSEKQHQVKGNSGRKHVSFIDLAQQPFQSSTQNKIKTARNNKNTKPKRRASSTLKEVPFTDGHSTYRDSAQHQKLIDIEDLLMTKKHLQQMDDLKKQTNKPLLPRISPKTDDIFDSFMKEKLLNKKVLTRRDITLNRIIMKNIVKESIGYTPQNIMGLKLDF